jgi:hypothetical protein
LKRGMWVWIRVPLEAVERAISLLKEAAMRGHLGASKSDNKRFSERLREKADADDQHAEHFKKAIRDGDGKKPPEDTQ